MELSKQIKVLEIAPYTWIDNFLDSPLIEIKPYCIIFVNIFAKLSKDFFYCLDAIEIYFVNLIY